jgi:hypothetical protein
VDERARTAARIAVADVCKAIAGARYRLLRDFSRGVADDFAKPAVRLPRGTFLHARVHQHLDGPDGRYVVLSPLRFPKDIAVRLDDLQGGPPGKTPAGPRRDPADGTWLVIGGTILSACNTGKGEAMFMLPVEWCPATSGAGQPPAAP